MRRSPSIPAVLFTFCTLCALGVCACDFSQPPRTHRQATPQDPSTQDTATSPQPLSAQPSDDPTPKPKRVLNTKALQNLTQGHVQHPASLPGLTPTPTPAPTPPPAAESSPPTDPLPLPPPINPKRPAHIPVIVMPPTPNTNP